MTEEEKEALLCDLANMKSKLGTKKCQAYEKLIELSELDNDLLTDDKCKNAELALEIALKYGTFEDGAKAIKLFGIFSIFKHILD